VTRASDQAGGNAIASAQVSLATHLEDPVERFETVHSSSQHAKELIHGMVSPVALNLYMGLLVVPLMAYTVVGRVERSHAQNVVISNVVGLREKRYVNGALIEADYPMSLLVPGQAMNITVISRRNMLDVAVLVCPDLAPEPQRVGGYIADALDELERALGRKRRRPGAATRRVARLPKPGRRAARRR
jgi:diacylglycerol O-acyltransferase